MDLYRIGMNATTLVSLYIIIHAKHFAFHQVQGGLHHGLIMKND